jgi:hypothetical protein
MLQLGTATVPRIERRLAVIQTAASLAANPNLLAALRRAGHADRVMTKAAV